VTPGSEEVPVPALGYLLHVAWRSTFRRFPAGTAISSQIQAHPVGFIFR